MARPSKLVIDLMTMRSVASGIFDGSYTAADSRSPPMQEPISAADVLLGGQGVAGACGRSSL